MIDTQERRTRGRAYRGDVAGRNEPCACGSGKKYKKCHGLSPLWPDADRREGGGDRSLGEHEPPPRP